MKSYIYSLVCLVLCAVTISCVSSADRQFKVKPIEERYITLDEFKVLFSERVYRIPRYDGDTEGEEHYLPRGAYYYYGHKDGFIYLSIQKETRYGNKRPKDPYAWKPQYHEWRITEESRYIVPEEGITFTWPFEFKGYNLGYRGDGGFICPMVFCSEQARSNFAAQGGGWNGNSYTIDDYEPDYE